MTKTELRKLVEFLRNAGWNDTQIVEILLYIAD